MKGENGYSLAMACQPFGVGETSLTFCEVCRKSFQSMPARDQGQRVETCCAEKREKENKY